MIGVATVSYQRFKKLLVMLAAFSIAMPTLAHAVTGVDEQWIPTFSPGAGYQGYLANESAFSASEASTWFNMTTSDGTPQGKVTQVAICNTGSEAGCNFSVKSMYRAVLPMCANETDTNCISAVIARDKDGKDLEISNSTLFPAVSPQAFSGNSALGVPHGGSGVLVTIPDATHDGGNQYLVKVVFTATRTQGQSKFESPNLSASITAVNPVSGTFAGPVTITNASKYDSTNRILVGSTRADNEQLDPRFKVCAMQSNTECALPYAAPKDITFGFTLRTELPLKGWLHGRMKNALIDLKRSETETVLTVSANPISVPTIDVWTQSSELSDAHVDYYAKKAWYGEGRHFPVSETNTGLPILDAEKTREGMKNISFQHINTDFSKESMNNFLKWLPVAKDKATALPTQWRLGTMIDRGTGKVAECLNKEASLAGVVTTNSTLYIDGPPTFDNKLGALDYKVASTHFQPDGTTVFKGSYELIMSSTIGRCIYGFSAAPIRADISVTSENGEPNVATTTFREAKNWMTLTAYNFTFSSPKVRVKLTQKKNQTYSINCVKGSKTKKVTGTSPKCPSGFRKAA
jgi:hypothetical protein